MYGYTFFIATSFIARIKEIKVCSKYKYFNLPIDINPQIIIKGNL